MPQGTVSFQIKCLMQFGVLSRSAQIVTYGAYFVAVVQTLIGSIMGFFVPRHMIVAGYYGITLAVRVSVHLTALTNVYLCVLKLWTLQCISEGFIPQTHKPTDLCIENYVQSTLVCLILDTQGYCVYYF